MNTGVSPVFFVGMKIAMYNVGSEISSLAFFKEIEKIN